MTKVWEHSKAYGGDLLILLAIANYSDVKGRAFPSIQTLAERARMTERNAQYRLRNLEALGELKIERNAGPHGTHLFQIMPMGENISGVKSFRLQKKRKRNNDLIEEKGENFSGVKTFRGETHFPRGVKPISPEPSLEPSLLLSNNTAASPSENSGQEEATHKLRKVPKSEQPGTITPELIPLISSMQIAEFHCLAEETKLNEQYWDAQIEYYSKRGVTLDTFADLIREVDKYYATNPEVLPRNAKSARARMNKGLEIAYAKHLRSRRYA